MNQITKTFLPLSNSTDDIKESSTIIIETAFVELKYINDENRKSHYEKAFQILNELTKLSFFDSIKANIFLDVFISDFKQNEDIIDCLDNCSIVENINEGNYQQLKQEISEKFKGINMSYNIKEQNIATFYMTATRNKVTKRIKRIMKDESKMNYFQYEKNNSEERIYVFDRFDNKINIGYRKDSQIIPNCVLLMSEHYFELFNFAYQINPSQKDYYIFDFLQHYESFSCEQGMEVAYKLFTWPKDVNVNIINYNYFDNEPTGVRHLGPFKF